MTRKKFVKQLMAMGYDRNSAEAQASIYAHMGYEDALAWVKANTAACNDFTAMLVRIADAMRPAVEAAVESIKRVAEGLSTIDWTDAAKRAAELVATADNAAAVHQEDALDALSYAAVIAGRGHGRSDMVLTERDFVEIDTAKPPAEFSTRYMGRWEISAEGGAKE